MSDRLMETGTVIEFDARRGLGRVEHADGRRFLFHCTQIADGTRTVPVGAVVSYELVPGTLGALEAANLTPTR